ncbi:MAG: sulfurtransferase [Saprospiraceae bacterium]
MKFGLIFSCLLVIFFTSCTSEQVENSTIVTEHSHSKADVIGRHLVSVQQVKEWIDSNYSMTIFEISKEEKYEAGHLPNAIQLWRPDYENKVDYEYGGMMASQQQMEALLSKNGVALNEKIVLYDTKGCVDAMRFRWILTLYGYDNIAVMNGGKMAWTKAGLLLSTEPRANIKSTLFNFVKAENLPQVATLEDIQAAILDTNTIILDTREPEEYYGKPYISKSKLYPYKKGAYTYGCIPTARHLNWSDAVDLQGDHCLKSLRDLHYNMKMAGVTADKTIITYCQSGVRSSHTTYVLTELLGYPNVKNYDGSWIEWSYRHQEGIGIEIEQHTPKAEYDRLLADLKKQLN